MNAYNLINLVNHCGAHIQLVDSNFIELEPVDLIPVKMIELIKDQKPQVIEALKSYPIDDDIDALMMGIDESTAQCLSPMLKHAYARFNQLLQARQYNLISKGYSPDKAAVFFDEYRQVLAKAFNIGYEEADQIKRDLIAYELVVQHGSFLYPIDNDQ